ncbi:MAG TPA: flippase activity-associated protein Agl23 [Thermomicrobiales bacterium]|nr:flippase activity-associated protein Agl23 [Thermomicrobiales bacterium]
MSGGATAAALDRSSRSLDDPTLDVERVQSPQLVTVETILYGVLAVLAIITRFWDLSSRAQHHDESLHAYFSWLYIAGDGYNHDPLMHGPTLFHANALAYTLFGDNDYTSRVWPALLGVALVLLPVLLRGPMLLGRWGALSCSTLLLFSPTILYYTRYIRHDPFVLVTTLAIVIAALRYLERPERRWVVVVGVMSGLLFATMEVSFILGFVLVTFVVVVVTWQISKAAFSVVIVTSVALLAIWMALPALGAPGLPAIPWEEPTSTNIRHFSRDLVLHPVFLASLGAVILGLIAFLSTIDRARDRDAGYWLDSVLAPLPRSSTGGALYSLLHDRRSLSISVGLGIAVVVALFTSMFTNMFGLASGTVGALGYWLGQHDVQRGDQPWFYYILMLLQYEFVGVFLFPIAIALTLRRLLPALRDGRPVDRRTYLRGFVIYWALMNLAVFSWAGEKMPWLTVHMSLPLAILAASVIGSGLERIELAALEGQLPGRAVWAACIGVPLTCASWFALWSWASAGEWERRANDLTRTLRPEIVDRPWVLYLPLIGLIALCAFISARLGSRVGVPVIGLVLIAVMLFAQMHVAFRMTYAEGDTPVDMLIYVQTSPDVARTVEELGVLSRVLNGDLGMQVAYDSGTSWPMQWYLRDYPNRSFFGSELTSAPDAPVVLISTDSLNDNPENHDMLLGYTYTEYAMRWWFPEDETYRRFAIAPELNKPERQNYQTDQQGPFTLGDVAGSVWRTVWSMRAPQQQAKIFRLVAFREIWAPIGSFNYRVYVRNDLVPLWDDIRY